MGTYKVLKNIVYTKTDREHLTADIYLPSARTNMPSVILIHGGGWKRLTGEAVSKEQATEMSRWPTRQEQISLLIGQILGVGATLNGQLLAMGGALASQIAKKGEGDDE